MTGLLAPEIHEKLKQQKLHRRDLLQSLQSNYSKARASYAKCVSVFYPEHPIAVTYRRSCLDPDIERLWPKVRRMMENRARYNPALVRRYLLLIDKALQAGIKTVPAPSSGSRPIIGSKPRSIRRGRSAPGAA